MKKPLCIFSQPEEMDQGLFGAVFYYLLQLLPYLHENEIYPQWHLGTLYYGDPPDRLTIPGVLDLAYTPPDGPYHRVSLAEMRRRHAHVLGPDWAALRQLWDLYFKVPQRVLDAAETILPAGRVLGVHYRGTDKQTNTWDSNPISQDQYISLIKDFLRQRPAFDAAFVGTDQPGFVEKLEAAVGLPVICLGTVGFHMAGDGAGSNAEKADRAMLDCVLFSKCDCLLQTSSALPSFAKLLNPDLESYRCAASKLFGKLYTKMPYFPVAHIPVLPVSTPESAAILAQTMHMDWTQQPETAQYQRQFTASPRWSLNHRIFGTAEKLGVDKLVGRVVRGYY